MEALQIQHNRFDAGRALAGFLESNPATELISPPIQLRERACPEHANACGVLLDKAVRSGGPFRVVRVRMSWVCVTEV
jgi:hypothetical protein